MTRFAAYVAIDWSGAKGKRHKGIAIAEARGDAAPRLIRPGHIWSREEVLKWLLRQAAKEPPYSGSTSVSRRRSSSAANICLGEPGLPKRAREFWAYVDSRCDDEDLGAASFLEMAHRRHFYFGIADGVKAGFVRFRQCDARLNAQGGRKTASTYDAIGAAQVAKASFSGMRLLHRLDGKVPIWPIDPLQTTGSTVVEIYTRIYLRRAGLTGIKLRSRAALNLALEGLGSRPARLRFEPNDHQTDALVTAAGMRQLALDEPRAFAPHGLTSEIAQSEGWTFGVL